MKEFSCINEQSEFLEVVFSMHSIGTRIFHQKKGERNLKSLSKHHQQDLSQKKLGNEFKLFFGSNLLWVPGNLVFFPHKQKKCIFVLIFFQIENAFLKGEKAHKLSFLPKI